MLAACLLASLLSVMPADGTVEVRLGPVQAAIVRAIRECEARYLDVEGALRSAKTWTCLIAIRTLMEEYPGMWWFMARWTEGDLNTKLVPDYRNVCALMGLPHGVWNSKESCYDIDNGSRIYAVHLKTSQRDNRYAAVRGFTVAGGYIDQLEEVPEDVYNEAALRISQPGFPQQMVVSPNPVPDSHWIAKKWPVKGGNPMHRYIRVAMRDNRHNLDAITITAAETLYPVGHPLRRTKIEGRRGLDVRGLPVYGTVFSRDRHVRNIDLIPDLPLCESYDYGFHHPCVLWYQYAPWGWVRVLGGVMGSDLFLDAFLPIVERYRELWFPSHPVGLRSTCDPAGAANNSQGLRGKPVDLLREWYQKHGERDDKGQFVSPMFLTDANQPENRFAANQRAAAYMRRQVNGDEAFLVDPERWALVELNDEKFDNFFVDGLEAGYVLEDDARHSSKLGSFWVPKKDGWFEHPQNCFEYGLQADVLDLPLGDEAAEEVRIKQDQRARREQETLLRRAQRDKDPQDRPRRVAMGRGRHGVRRTGRGRAGY